MVLARGAIIFDTSSIRQRPYQRAGEQPGRPAHGSRLRVSALREKV